MLTFVPAGAAAGGVQSGTAGSAKGVQLAVGEREKFFWGNLQQQVDMMARRQPGAQIHERTAVVRTRRR